ncbi:MAG: AsmA family protein [Burkholderiales bacterium]
MAASKFLRAMAMKVLKWIAIVAGGVVLLIAATLGFIAATFDPNQYKAQVAELVKEKTGRTLTIEGDIRLTFFPKIGVHLGKTRLSEFQNDKEFAGLDDMRVSLALFPLLSRQVVVDRIRLDGLRASLVRHQNGKTNFDDLIGGNKEPAPAKPAPVAKSTSPIKLEVDGVEIGNAALSWKDEKTGAQYAISAFNLNTGGIAPGVPTVFDMSARIQGNAPKADVQFGMRGTLRADLDAQVFSLSALHLNLKGEAAGISGLSADLLAEIEARMQSNQIDIGKLVFETAGSLGKDTFKARLTAPKIGMQGNALSVTDLIANVGGQFAGVNLTQGQLRVPQFTMNLDTQTILVDGVVLSASGKRDADSFEAKLDAPKISITRETAGGNDVTLMLKAQGPQLDANVGLKLSGVEGTGKSVRIGQFSLNVDATQVDNKVKGTLSTPVLANLESRVLQLPKLDGEFDVVSQALPMKQLKIPVVGSVAADFVKQTATVNLGVKLDQSNIKAKFSVADFAALRSTFDIAIDKLNVDKYLPPKTSPQTANAPTSPTPEQPIDFTPLKSLATTGSVRIGELIASNVKMQNLRVDLKAKDGILVIDPLSANLYQGSVKGSASVDANTRHITIRQNLTGISIGPLLRDALNKDILEGRGNVELDLRTTGNLVSAMTRALNGTARLDLRDGAIKGIDLGQSLRNVKTMFGGGKREAEQGAAAGEKTVFSELSASFDIKNGIAHNGDFLTKSPLVRLNGSGDINLPDSSLDYLAKATAGGNSKGLTLPVRAYGPFSALKFKLDLGAAMSDATKQKLEDSKEAVKERFEEKKEAAKAKAEEKKDALKGKLESKLLDKTDSAAPAAGTETPAAPTPSMEDKLKEKLKKKIF